MTREEGRICSHHSRIFTWMPVFEPSASSSDLDDAKASWLEYNAVRHGGFMIPEITCDSARKEMG